MVSFRLPLYLISASLLAKLGAAINDAWHLDDLFTLVIEELDPIVTPNGQASHMHRVFGGSAFGASYNYPDQMKSSCTTASITVDKSNYWVPQMYWFTNTTNPTFYQMYGHARFYLHMTNDGTTRTQAFPPGLRMLANNPNSKTANPDVVQFMCDTSDTTQFSGPDFNFNQPCPSGVAVTLMFPNCWDGINLYKSDGSHMVYAINGGNCPYSNPIMVPQIQFEFAFTPPPQFAQTAPAGHLAWANGDTTGFGAHGDFINGWDTAILQAALNDTNCVGTGVVIPIQQCPSLAPYFNVNAAAACYPDKGTLAEPYGNVDNAGSPALPGCNPLWGATGPKPTCNPEVPPLDVSHFQGTDGPYTATTSQVITYPTTPAWTKFQCLASPAFSGTFVSFNDAKLTVERCTDSCSKNGFPVAGMFTDGQTWYCECATAVNTDAGVSRSNDCSTPCPGNSTEMCGGVGYWSIYYQPSQYSQSLTPAYNMGCYNIPNSGMPGFPASTQYSFSSSSMTIESCVQGCLTMGYKGFAAVSGGNACSCGTSLSSGSGTFVPADFCTVPCSGNSAEICGDLYKMNVFNLGNTTATTQGVNRGSGRLGCYSLGSSSVPLSGFSWVSTATMTPTVCEDGCNQLSYSLSAVQSGNTCYCGNAQTGGQLLPDSQCTTPCGANSTLTCGGTYNYEMFYTNVSTNGLVQQQAKHLAGWTGCFNDPSGNALTPYSYYSTQMTPSVCQTGCAQLGYPYAGVTQSGTCKCGNNAPTTTQQPVSFCYSQCTGNSSLICGGPSNTDVYTTSQASVPNYKAMNGANWLGCYDLGSNPYNLNGYQYISGSMTNEMCSQSCGQLGYTYAGTYLSYGCICGNSLANIAVYPPSSCNQQCLGNSTEYCGGTSQFSAFTSSTTAALTKASMPPGWIGCYAEPSNGQALSGYSYTASAMTSSACKATCASQGFSLAATESGNRCYCGNALSGATLYPANQCTTPCGGNSTEICGGPAKFDLYNATVATTVPTTTATGYIGCYADISTLNGFSYSSGNMSANACVQACNDRGYAYGGTQNSNCMCGGSSPVQVVPDSACNTVCSGNSTQYCGSNSDVSLYNIATAMQAITKSGTMLGYPAGALGYTGCYSDVSSSRLLQAYSYYTGTMTITQCISTCQKFGYAIAGVGSGVSCYCGNTRITAGGAGLLEATSDCNVNCPGDSTGTTTCGGNDNRVQTYDVAKSGVTYNAPAIPGYSGCYAYGSYTNGASASVGDNGMTSDFCRAYCLARGVNSVGLLGTACYCGSSSNFGALQPDSQCNTFCPGNSTELCGSSSAISGYTTAGAVYVPPPGFAPGYVGCYSDNGALNGFQTTSSLMTGPLCLQNCKARGFLFGGVENGSGCFCGNTMPTLLVPEAYCGTACGGNSSALCGSSNTWSVYSVAKANQQASAATSTSTTASSTSATSTTVSSTIASTSSTTAAGTTSTTSTTSKPASTSTSTTSSSATTSKPTSTTSAVGFKVSTATQPAALTRGAPSTSCGTTVTVTQTITVAGTTTTGPKRRAASSTSSSSAVVFKVSTATQPAALTRGAPTTACTNTVTTQVTVTNNNQAAVTPADVAPTPARRRVKGHVPPRAPGHPGRGARRFQW